MTKPIKVLHLHTRAVVGGSSTNVLLTINKLSQDKFQAHLACGFKNADSLFLEQIREKNITIYEIKHLRNSINPVCDILALFEIISVIKKEKYQIVHTHNSKAGILGRLAARFCKVPVIVHTIHSCVFRYTGTGVFRKTFYMFLEKIAARTTDKFIAISPHLKEEFSRNGIAKNEQIEIVYSGIELDKFRNNNLDVFKKKKELGLNPTDLVISTISRIEKGKGHDLLLDAARDIISKNSKIIFLLVGDGPLKSHLEERVKNDNMYTNIRFAGLRLDAADIIKASDIVCIPSFYEGMCRVVLEAQASGKPVVATRAGGIPDIVNEGLTAILTTPADQDSLITAILKLAQDENLRKKMGAAAEKFIDRSFSSGKMVNDIEKIYDDMLIDNGIK